MSDAPERVTDSTEQPEDRVDYALRPTRLREMIGQDQVKENLDILVRAARRKIEA